jgi:uncharacterized protein (TIGR02246 family)
MDGRRRLGGRMKTLISTLIVVMLSAPQAVHTQTNADEAAVGKVPQAFAAAWAKHNGHQLELIMASDMDFVNVGGDWIHGRADFELYYTRLLVGRLKESTLTPVDRSVRFLRPDPALLHWSWRLEGDRNEDLTPRKPRMGIFTMVVEKRSGDWLVVAAQNSNFLPGPNPELDGVKPSIVFPQ